MLKIVMDSAGDIPSEWIDRYDVHVIPINIHFGEKTYFQGVDLTNNDFYRLVEESGKIPKTSQPTPGQFKNFYRNIAEPGDTILSIHVTSKLSGTFESAELAARDLRNVYEIYPFDSGGGSVSMGFMCKDARQMDRENIDVQKILERMAYIRKHTQVILTLNTMEYARMSGRVRTLQAAIASLLNVKPIIVLNDGILDVVEKVRTRGRSLNRVIELMIERIGEKLVDLAVVHAQDEHIGEQLLNKVRQVFNYKELIFSELSIGVAANLGPGTMGIVACPAREG